MLKLKLYPRHFVDTAYFNIYDCPIARASKEQLEGEFSVGGTTVDGRNNTSARYSIENAREFALEFRDLRARASKMKEDEVVYTINLTPYD